MTNRMPPLKSLQAFAAAGKYLSFKRAAAELNLTPSAVSHRIRTLEAQLKVPLFRRSNRSLALTDIGQTYYRVVQSAFTGMSEATEAINPSHPKYTLSVYVPRIFTELLLLPGLAGFREKYSYIDLRLRTTRSIDIGDFEHQPVDAAIRLGFGTWPGLISERLTATSILPVCSPALLSGPVPLSQPEHLAEHTWLHVTTYPSEWQDWLAGTGCEHVSGRDHIYFDDSGLKYRAAIARQGVAIGLDVLMKEYFATGALTPAFDRPVANGYGYYLLYRAADAHKAPLRALREWLFALISAE